MHGHRHIDWMGECGDLLILSASSSMMPAAKGRDDVYFYVHTVGVDASGRIGLADSGAGRTAFVEVERGYPSSFAFSRRYSSLDRPIIVASRRAHAVEILCARIGPSPNSRSASASQSLLDCARIGSPAAVIGESSHRRLRRAAPTMNLRRHVFISAQRRRAVRRSPLMVGPDFPTRLASWLVALLVAVHEASMAQERPGTTGPATTGDSVTLFSNVRIFNGKDPSLSALSNVLVRGNTIERISTAPINVEREATCSCHRGERARADARPHRRALACVHGGDAPDAPHDCRSRPTSICWLRGRPKRR